MSQGLTNIDKAVITPLAEYVEAALVKDSQDASLLSLKEEVAKARHTLSYFEPLLQKYISIVNSLPQESDNFGSAVNTLILYGERYTQAINQFTRITKAASEIELSRSTKLDSIQVLNILNQVPSVLQDILEKLILEIVDEIQTQVEAQFVSDAHIKDMRASIKFFGRLQKAYIHEVITRTLEDVQNQLRELSVVHDKENIDETPGQVTMEQLREMMETVPVEAEPVEQK